ncbi:hypothetical protein DYB36_000644 [Aphanomyces astaci]|uniref:Uncharacterized protein n=1 Tax=Aphanomyces astaci TaxID=112090 RepID=A0A397B0Q9_APHAT|nr:hypothetical protein DYB36_000644 [Aphanomyces astaci]
MDDQSFDTIGMTALHLAVSGDADVDVVKCLVEAHSEIENACTDEYSAETVLITAVISSKFSVVEYLVNAGANIEASNKSGYTAISLAIYKDIQFGKMLYAKYQASVNSSSATNLVAPLKDQQTSSSSLDLLHIGDYVTLNLGDDQVLGCDGFVQTFLQPTEVNSEWDDGVFCIHPQLAYDHVDMTSTCHPYFEVTDRYSEHEREKKRNVAKLSQMLRTKDVVVVDTIFQLFHVKSQKYLRVNPMAGERKANVIACIPKLYKGNRKPKPVHLVDDRSNAELCVALHCTYDRFLHHPFTLVTGSSYVCGDGLRQFPLSNSASLALKSDRVDALAAFELQKTPDGSSYEIRHVVSRFVLGIDCPCSKKEQLNATLVNSATTSNLVAKLKLESKAKSLPNHPPLGDPLETDMAGSLYQVSHTCLTCGNKWCLSTQENQVVASKQICDLMENPFVGGVAECLQRICSEIVFLDAMFLTTSVFRSMAPAFRGMVDEVLAHFFKAMRVMVVGNDSFEAYLVEQFEHPIGKIKILSGLDIQYASKFVDARTILTSMIGKNTRTVAYLLEAINTDDQLDTLSWTNKAQFLIALSYASRRDPLISYKLYNHEIAIAHMWLQNWDTMSVYTFVQDGDVWVRWNDCCSGRIESPTSLNRWRVQEVGTLRTVFEEAHIAMPLRDIVSALDKARGTPAHMAMDSWMISYLHHLKLVAALCKNNADVRPRFHGHFPPDLLMDGACSDALSCPIQSLYLELFQLLYVPTYGVPESVQLTTLFLGIRDLQVHLTPFQLKRLDGLIQAKLVPPTKQDKSATFGFIERLLIAMETLINVGWYTSEKGRCVQAIEMLYAVGMAWDDDDLKFETVRHLEADPFNLHCRSTSGTTSVNACLRRLLGIARKLTRFSVVAKPQKGLKLELKQPIVHFLSRLLNHDDKIVAQEAFLNLSELLPDHSFSWLQHDKLLCSALKKSDHSPMLKVFADANAIFNEGAHIVHGFVEVKTKTDGADGKRKKSKALSANGLQLAAQKINQWISESTKSNLLFLRLADVPNRIVAYIEDSLAKNLFVVPTNDILAAEWRYYLTTVAAFDLSDNESLFLYRQSKERILDDRVALVEVFLGVIHMLAPYLTGDLCVALLNVMVPLLHARPSLVKTVSKVVTKLLKQPFVELDGRFTKIFNALLNHIDSSDEAGQCVLHMLRQSNSDDWKRETMVFLFHSNFDLASVTTLLTSNFHTFEIICLVADGSTNESIYGHLESKSLMPLEWMVDMLSLGSVDAQRASLQLIKTMYLESDVATSWMSTDLPKTIKAFEFCRQHLATGAFNESVLLLGIIPFVRAWNALALKYKHLNVFIRDFHVQVRDTLESIAGLLKEIANDHRIHCSNAEQRLDSIVASLGVPSVCSNMIQVTMAAREIKCLYEDPKFAIKLNNEMDPNACKCQFYRQTGKLLADNMAPYLLYNDSQKQIPSNVLRSTKKIAQCAGIDNDLKHLQRVADYLVQIQMDQAQPDLLALIMEQQEMTAVANATAKSFKWPRSYLHKQLKTPRAKPNERKFGGKNYFTMDIPPDDDADDDADVVDVHDSPVHQAYKKWTSKAEPLDTQTLMESLVRLITLSSSASILGLRVFIQSLASKRVVAADRTVLNQKFLLHSRLEWKKMISTAVKANATSLVFWCVGESMKEALSPTKSRLAMDLISELLADGFKEGQDSLYAGYDSLDVHYKGLLFQFLTSHVGGISHEITVVTLKLFQQLCEGHHANWQNVMRSSRFHRSVLDTVINLMSRICNQADGMFSLANIEILTSSLVFLSEVCQGPCLDNQQYLVESVVPRLCADLSLDKIKCENGQYPLHLTRLKHRSNELLLSLGEGRTDDLVHVHLAELLRPQPLLDVISANRAQIKELRKASRKLELADAYFVETIELLRVVYSLLSKAATADWDNEVLVQFAKHWDEVQLGNDDVDFFAKQIISVEIVRGDSAINVYFPQPKEAKFLRQPEKRRLLDIMDLGEDNALVAFTSTDARCVPSCRLCIGSNDRLLMLDGCVVCRNLAEELRARHVLASNVEYAWMNEWQTIIRWWMFAVGFYINFVMVLGLALNPDTADPVVHIWIEWFLSVLGGVFCILCSCLWLYNVITETTFSYARQLLRPSKLRRMTRDEIKHEIWNAVGSAGYTIVGWLAIFAVIIMEFGFDDDVTFVILKVSGAYIAVLVVLSLRKIGDIYHFAYVEGEKVQNTQGAGSNMLFWFNAIIDTITRDNFYVFTTYTFCAFMGLAHDTGYSCFMWYGLPLLDILAINARLSNIVRVVRVTLAFGAIVIYLFSLVGFFRYQDLMTDSASELQCSSLMQCYFTFMHYGLLSGGGIGDYISNTLAHPLDYATGTMFHERLVFDLAFYIFILVLLINLIMGIIIDSFTSLRESSERKLEIEMNTCLVCNDSKDDIEYRGILGGFTNNFKRHTETEHNLWNYLFFIMYLDSKPSTNMNGTESFAYQKLLAKDMSWLPKRLGVPVEKAVDPTA